MKEKEVLCEVFDKCGGCKFLDVEYHKQLENKDIVPIPEYKSCITSLPVSSANSIAFEYNTFVCTGFT